MKSADPPGSGKTYFGREQALLAVVYQTETEPTEDRSPERKKPI
jgi:hypothetical protein